MDIVIKIFRFLFISIVLLLMDSSCSKKPELPAVITAEMTEITQTYATSGGTVMDDGGADVMDSGVCWSTTENPTISDNKASCCAGTGSFIIRLTKLSPGTIYYVRAYATTEAGTSYGTEISFTTQSVNPPTFDPDLTYGTITDIDGNIYKTIQIGTRTWMAENLKTTKYNDGTSIPLVMGDNNWANRSSAAMCWFNDDPGIYKDIYGGYYNIYAVKTKKLCPEGWHVPDKTDWSQMISYLGNEGSAGGKMKESGTLNWMSPNYGATNESGFTGLPAGYRRDKFIRRGISANWWSATSNQIYSGFYYDSYVLDYRYRNISVYIMTYSTSGLNVRCVKDQ